jgi:hypothetical protein
VNAGGVIMRKYLAAVLVSASLTGAVFAAPAQALPVTATYSGTVESAYIYKPSLGSFDESLTGQAFTLSFTFDPDTAGAIRITGSDSDQLYGGTYYGSADPILSAVLTIGSFVYDFDTDYFGYAMTQHGVNGISPGLANLVAEDGFSGNGVYRYAQVAVYLYTLANAAEYPGLLDEAVTIFPDPADTHDASFSINECHYIVAPCDQIDDLNYKMIYGTLNVTRYEVRNGQPSAVPVPETLPLLASALAGMGFFGWRRRRA